jgi:hypothetical protein
MIGAVIAHIRGAGKRFDEFPLATMKPACARSKTGRIAAILSSFKPSESVRAAIKSEVYRFDPSVKLWYKPIDQAKHIQSRQEADELVYKGANMIRAEKAWSRKTTVWQCNNRPKKPPHQT